MAHQDPRVYDKSTSSREFSDYPGHEGEEPVRRRAAFSPIQEEEETNSRRDTASYSPYDRKIMSINREHQSSPKHPPHPHSPSSSSSGHSSPRSPPSHPPPPLPPSATGSASGPGLKQQRPSHPSPSHTPRSKSHDILYGYHGDPNKAGSNWKSSPSMQRGHTRASSDPKKQELLALLTGSNERGPPLGSASPQISQQRHHLEPMGDHVSPRSHHSSRFSPEGIQAETGERGGGRGEPKPPPRGVDPSSLVSSSNYAGRGGKASSLASVSYDSQIRSGGVASGEGGEGKEVIPTNHVALRVAQFSGGERQEGRDEGGGGGGGGGGGRSREKVPSPAGNIRSPELEKAKILTVSPGSSEEELSSIHSESGLPEGSESTDMGYYHHHHKGEPGMNFDPGHAHQQLSQPTYLNRAPPSSSSQPPFPHNPASFPSLSQPHPSLSYETTIHHRSGSEYPPNRSFPSPHVHQKHHSHQTHYRMPPQPNPPPQSHDYHQRSHDHHVTGYSGSHDPHVTGYPGMYEQHHISPHHEHHVTPQNRSYRQQGHAHSQYHSQQGHAHQRPPISKQNLLKAHEAAANNNLNTLRHMLVNHEIDSLCMDDTGLTLAHSAAMTNNLSVIVLLINEGGLPLQALQFPDEHLVSPAMVAIQNGCLEVLQWLVEEGKVPLVVQDAGGETLLHHAAHHGSANCLQWLLKVAKPPKQEELVEFLDNFGVTPAHFAAQQGHLECLQLMIDYNYSVVTPDKESQKPIDWADAMNQTLCVRYLFMHETCWGLSADVAHLSKQLEILQRENGSLKEKLSSQEQEYQQTLGKIQTHHEERIVKMREQYVDLTASLLKVKDRDTGGGGVAGGGASPKVKSQPATRKDSSRRSKPPIPPDSLKKREGGGGGGGGEGKGEGVDCGGGGGGGGVGFYRTTTPQEVLEKQKNTLTLRMNASRKAREGRDTLVSRAFSPIHYRFNSRQEREGKPALRSQRHPDQNKPPLKVKFSEVNQYIDHSHYGDASSHGRHGSGTHPGDHGEQDIGSRKGQSPSHKSSGHPSPSHSGHGSPGHSLYGSPGHGGERSRHEDQRTSHQ